MSERPDWMNDPLVSHIDPEKLNFIKELADNSRGKSQKEMMPYMMSVMKKAKASGITFSPAEFQAAVAAIRKYSTPEELEKMDEIMKKVSPK